MSDLEALFRAVLDRPDDDTPRLVYADALDDLGAADRAAFVRQQVEAARAAPWEPAAVRSRYFGGDTPPGAELPELPPGLAWDPHPFRRGFPAAVEARDAAAFADAHWLFELAPVESLEIEFLQVKHVTALAACPGLARLKRLAVRSGLSRGMARELFASPHLSHLDELVVGADYTSAVTAQVVVDAPRFRQLRSLAYRDDQPGGAMVAALSRMRGPASLRVLNLQGNRLTPDGLRRLLDAPLTAGLECLDVGDNHLGADGFRELVGGDRLPALRRLDAMRIGLGSAGVSELTGSVLASRLHFLNLAGNALGPNAAAALAATDLSALRVLDLSDNRLGDAGVAHLLHGNWVASVLQLDLSENGVGVAGAESLMAAEQLFGILALSLGGNPIPPQLKRELRRRFGERVLV